MKNRSRTILNRAFGRALWSFLNRPEIFDILGAEGTWSAGGCWILADALMKWIGPQATLKMIASDRCTSEHVVVQVGEIFIHATGVRTKAELLDEMQESERLANPRIVEFHQQALKRNDVPTPGERSRRLECQLRVRFGERPSLISNSTSRTMLRKERDSKDQLHRLPAMNNESELSPRMLIVSCSARKVRVEGLVPAWTLYDGVTYRMLKRLQRMGEWPQGVDIFIVSARYGLIRPDTPIAFYDELMTEATARRQAERNRQLLRRAFSERGYAEVFVAMGRTYLAALEPTSDWLPGNVPLQVAQGGSGRKMRALKIWLAAANSPTKLQGY